jgi:predicted hydrocarbon binding protein
MLECSGCFGMPRMEVSLCDFEAGLITGAVEALAKDQGITYWGKEIECTSLGNYYCKFEIKPTIIHRLS